MKKSTYQLIIAILAMVIVLGGAGLLYQCLAGRVDADSLSADATEATEKASYAPNFTVQDAQGNPYRLSDYMGTPVVLNFWASWCGPCKSEMPEFEAAYQEYGDKIQFMMINLTDGYSETVESASEFIHSEGYTFPLFFDTNMEAAVNYGTSAIPVTCFIDAQGRLVHTQVGVISSDALHQWIDLILPE